MDTRKEVAPKAEEEGESSSSEANAPVAAAPANRSTADQAGATSEVGRWLFKIQYYMSYEMCLNGLNDFKSPTLQFIHTLKMLLFTGARASSRSSREQQEEEEVWTRRQSLQACAGPVQTQEVGVEGETGEMLNREGQLEVILYTTVFIATLLHT